MPISVDSLVQARLRKFFAEFRAASHASAIPTGVVTPPVPVGRIFPATRSAGLPARLFALWCVSPDAPADDPDAPSLADYTGLEDVTSIERLEIGGGPDPGPSVMRVSVLDVLDFLADSVPAPEHWDPRFRFEQQEIASLARRLADQLRGLAPERRGVAPDADPSGGGADA